MTKKSAPHLHLTNEADAAGTCPVCRVGHLKIEDRVYHARTRPGTITVRSAVCSRCNYAKPLPSGTTVDGV